jgi:hypothetical protein
LGATMRNHPAARMPRMRTTASRDHFLVRVMSAARLLGPALRERVLGHRGLARERHRVL